MFNCDGHLKMALFEEVRRGDIIRIPSSEITYEPFPDMIITSVNENSVNVSRPFLLLTKDSDDNVKAEKFTIDKSEFDRRNIRLVLKASGFAYNCDIGEI